SRQALQVDWWKRRMIMRRRLVACVGIALAVGSMAMAADQELIKAPPEKPLPIPEEMAGDAVGFRVRLGLKDTEPTDWSGEVKVSAGKVLSIRGWRWAAGDSAKGSTWTTTTRRQTPQNAAQQARQAANQRLPMQDTGVVITFAEIKPDS